MTSSVGSQPPTEVSQLTTIQLENRDQREGREVRGPVDHRLVRSIYFRDPNGYVIELTASPLEFLAS